MATAQVGGLEGAEVRERAASFYETTGEEDAAAESLDGSPGGAVTVDVVGRAEDGARETEETSSIVSGLSPRYTSFEETTSFVSGLSTAGGASFVLRAFDGEPRWTADLRYEGLTYKVKARPKSQVRCGSGCCGCCRCGAAELTVLAGLSGALRSGTSTLLLGPPGCGKTSLLRALAGRLGGRVAGSVTVGGIAQEELQMSRVAALAEQNDRHLPLMSVRDTLGFAAALAGGAAAFGAGPGRKGSAESGATAAVALESQVDELIASLGLRAAAGTIVGNAFIRGVSGGERKRTTLGEMLFSRAPLLLLDEITSGLDSATARDCVGLVTASARSLRSVVLATLLQPAPDVIALFDELILMGPRGGKVLYHGPVNGVEAYFARLGFTAGGRELGEFLIDMTSGRRRAYFNVGQNLPAAARAPGLAELTRLWEAESAGNLKALDKALDKAPAEAGPAEAGPADAAPAKAAPAEAAPAEAATSLDSLNLLREPRGDSAVVALEDPLRFYGKAATSPFVLGRLDELKVVMLQQVRLLWSERLVVLLVLSLAFVLSLIAGLLFIDTPLSPLDPGDGAWARNRTVAAFYILFVFQLNAFVQIPWTLIRRDVLYKHNEAGLLRTGSFVVAQAFAQVVTALPETLIGTGTVFLFVPMVSLRAPDAGAVLGQLYLVGLAFNLSVNGLVRLCSYCSPGPVVAFLANTLMTSCFVFGSGFVLSEANFPAALRYLLFWTSPMSWAMRAGVITVFGSETFAHDGLGAQALAQFDMRTERFWVPAGIWYLLALWLLALALQSIVLRHVRYVSAGGGGGSCAASSDSPEDDEEEHDKHDGGAAAEQREQERELKRAAVEAKAAERLNSVLPCPRVHFAFRDICYSVKVKGQYNLLVDHVSGVARSGRLCAIVGATGAGKTTTLDVLAGRKTVGVQTGLVLVNGVEVARSAYLRVVGYCEQEDNHLATVTVREAVLFSASLRLPPGLGQEARNEFVDEILATLQLAPLAGYVVGVKGKGGLSVGQFKRLTVAVEMAANPAILFLDEPTSGLDSTAAEVTVGAVKRLSRAGRTVLCTIHQPSRELVMLFDDILLLQKGGRVAYHGRVDAMVAYFAAIERNALPVPEGEFNPSVYVLDVLGAGVHGQAKSGRRSSPHSGTARFEFGETELPEEGDTADYDYAAHFAASPEGRAVAAAIEELQTQAQAQSHSLATGERPSALVATAHVVRRWCIVAARSSTYHLQRAGVMLCISTLVGLSSENEDGLKTIADASGFVGLIFFATTLTGFLCSAAGLPLWFEARDVFYRERSARAYSAAAYVLGSTVAETSSLLFASLLAGTVLYLTMGLLHDAAAFFWFQATFFLSNTASAYLGMLLSSVASVLPLATVLATTSALAFIVFSGFFVSYANCPAWLRPFYWLSPHSYAINGLVMSQLSGCPCTVDAQSALLANFTCNAQQSCSETCNAVAPGCEIMAIGPLPPSGAFFHTTITQFMKEQFGIDERAAWVDMLALLAFCLVFRVCDIVALASLKSSKR